MNKRTTDLPQVWVLILNWRGWRDTIECLESVFKQDYPNYRVIVCDNASGDDSLEQIEKWAAAAFPFSAPEAGGGAEESTSNPAPISVRTYDREQIRAADSLPDVPLVLIRTGGNLGFAGGNNVGMEYVLGHGTAGYIWLLNNDTVVDPQALRMMVEVAEADSRIGVVGSKLLDFDPPHLIQTIGGGTLRPWRGLTDHIGTGERDEGQWETSFEPDYITGASMLVRTELVRRVGKMDERYFLYSEEVDWCLRARREGWKLAYAPGSVVRHKGGGSIGYKSPLHDYHSVRSMLLLVRKFYPHLLPLTFAYSVVRCLAPKVVRLQPKRFLAVMRAYRDFLREGRSQPENLDGHARRSAL